MNILIGQVGKIVKGEEYGNYVKVVDDSAKSGGFLILTSQVSDMSSGHDNWVADLAALNSFFEESGWVIEWL